MRFSLFTVSSIVVIVLMTAGCSAPNMLQTYTSGWRPSGSANSGTVILGRSAEYVVVLAAEGDSLKSLAARFLGDESRYWMIADANDSSFVTPGQEVVIPLRDENPTGVRSDGYDTVTILTYHRFGHRPDKMTVTPGAFEAQMAYLAEHDYRVISLAELVPFLRGDRPLPRRAVVITVDDGWKSTYSLAYPILTKYGYPATLFVYSDFIRQGGLSWPQIEEMGNSGLISIQAHSKTHSNLAIKTSGEDESAYRRRVRREVRVPSTELRERLTTPVVSFAYPYGDTNDYVIEQLERNDYALGLTVQRGGTPAFAYPYMLRRTMIYGNRGLDAFANSLNSFQSVALR